MTKQNQEPIEAKNVEVNDKADAKVAKDDRNWVEKQIDEHPKGFIALCTVAGAALGAAVVAGVSMILGGDGDTAHTAVESTYDPAGDVAAEVAAEVTA